MAEFRAATVLRRAQILKIVNAVALYQPADALRFVMLRRTMDRNADGSHAAYAHDVFLSYRRRGSWPPAAVT